MSSSANTHHPSQQDAQAGKALPDKLAAGRDVSAAQPVRNIVMFFDGTWNTPESNTNVYRLFDNTVGPRVKLEKRKISCDDDQNLKLRIKLFTQRFYPSPKAVSTERQIKYYDRGVGTGLLNRFSGGVFGTGLEQNIKEAYQFLCHYHCDWRQVDEPSRVFGDDHLYFFGFSRGSYTARSLVGMISALGLLPADKATTDNVTLAFDIYKEQNQQKAKNKKVGAVLVN